MARRRRCGESCACCGCESERACGGRTIGRVLLSDRAWAKDRGPKIRVNDSGHVEGGERACDAPMRASRVRAQLVECAVSIACVAWLPLGVPLFGCSLHKDALLLPSPFKVSSDEHGSLCAYQRV
eukprot:4922509-Pleurochrysis_carterae.AAC.5